MATEKATFAAGCFWGVEKCFAHQFADKSIKTKVGYIGGKTNINKPTYKEVCTGNTGYAEALEITFDPAKVPYAELVEYFYRMHDATTKNSQGPDVGTQYRSAIFYHTPKQQETAKAVTAQIQETRYSSPIVTEIVSASEFYDAEKYHQDYLTKNPHGYECPTHFNRW